MNQFKCNYLKIEKYFLNIFSAFPESTQKFEYFGIKDKPQRLFVSEITDLKKRDYLNR